MRKRYLAFGCTGLGLLGALASAALALAAGLILALALVVLPRVARDKIQVLIAEQIDQNVDAEVSMGDLDVSLISSFPRLKIRARDIKIVGRVPFQKVTLAEIPELEVKVQLLSALSGQTVTVKSVTLTDPKFVVKVLPNGRTNTDILKGSGGSGPSSGPSMTAGWNLSLDEVTVKNLSARYDDRKGRMKVLVSDLDLVVSADLSEKVSVIDAEGTIGGLTFRKGRTTWLLDTRWALDTLLDYDLETGGIVFRENQVTVNAFPASLTGSVIPAGRGWDIDLAFSAADATFASLLSLVPNAYRGTMEGVDTAGTLAFSGTAKGRYGGDKWPGFDLTVGVRDARFKYPDLPVAIQNIDVDLKAHHQEGPPDTARIDVGRFAFAVAGSEPFVASAKITHPLTDPVVEAEARGHLDLKALRGAIPLPEGTEPPTGEVDVDVAFSGSRSDFLEPNPERIRASGTIQGRNVTYRSEDLPVAVVIDEARVALASDSARLESFAAHYGDSDIAARGRLDNLVGYALGGETLTGRLSLSSKQLDLRPFQGADDAEDPVPAEAEEAGLLVAVPPDLDLSVDADLGRVVTKQLDLEKVKGTMTVRESAVRMKDLKVSMLGGSALMSGAYVAPTAESADVDFALTAVKFDVGRTLAAVTTLQEIVPVLAGAAGAFDLGINAKTRLSRDGSPDLKAMASSGMVRPAGVEVRPQSLSKAAQQLGSESYSTINLGGAQISYAMANGKVSLQPFSVKLGKAQAKLGGSAGIVDETVDFTFRLKVPTRGLDGTLLAGVAAALGPDVAVAVRARGAWSSPKITVALDGASPEEAVVDIVESLLGVDADQSAAEILAEARKAADRLLDAADDQADKLLASARGNPIAEAAAAEGAKRIRNEAKKAADKVLADAEKAAASARAKAPSEKKEAPKEGGPAPKGVAAGKEGAAAKTGKAAKAGKAGGP